MFSALIIDDEKRAINGLKLLLETHIPDIDPIYTALGSSEGFTQIQKLHPHLVFLDVEMPGMTGFEMLDALKDIRVNVIFTTAYDHYAIKAIRFSAIDYLLKPIDVQELKAAVNRFIQRPLSQDQLNPLIDNLVSNLRTRHLRKPRLAITTGNGLTFLDIDEIVNCQADNNYTIFHLCNGKRFVSSKTLKEFDELLAEYDFLRVHQSYLVNPVFIKEYSQKGILELKDSRIVNVSRRKHHWLLEKLKSMYR